MFHDIPWITEAVGLLKSTVNSGCMWKPLRPKQGVAHEHPHPANYYKLCWNVLNFNSTRSYESYDSCSFCVCLALDVLPVSQCFCVFMFGLPPTNSRHRPASPTTLSASGKFCGNMWQPWSINKPTQLHGVTWSYINYFQNLPKVTWSFLNYFHVWELLDKPNMERLVLQYL